MRSPRPTYANVTATLALFIALGGTSWAVTQLPRNSVGERQLRANAVTSAKVRDGAISRNDLAADAILAGARGARGAAGPQGGKGDRGADGATGPAGPRGPADIMTAATATAVPLALGGPSTATVVTLVDVPPGRWWVLGSASAVYIHGASDFFRCNLTFGGTNSSAASVARVGGDAGGAFAAALTVHEGRELTGPTTIRLVCGHDAALPGGNPKIDHAQVTAIRTDNLQIQGG